MNNILIRRRVKSVTVKLNYDGYVESITLPKVGSVVKQLINGETFTLRRCYNAIEIISLFATTVISLPYHDNNGEIISCVSCNAMDYQERNYNN